MRVEPRWNWTNGSGEQNTVLCLTESPDSHALPPQVWSKSPPPQLARPSKDCHWKAQYYMESLLRPCNIL